MKNCELCQLPARTFCESDQAILCWDCDAKVHGANFLVARHSRSLLCHSCQSATPWKASGEKLGHTFSVCQSCVVRGGSRDDGDDEESHGGNDQEFDSDNDEIDGDSDPDDHDDDDDDEDGDNQVVPWSSTTPPPPSSSESSGQEEEATSAFNNGEGDSETADASAVSLKRIRETTSDRRSEDDLNRSSPRRRFGGSSVEPGIDSSRPRKDRRRIDLNEPGSPSEAVIESVMRYSGRAR